MNTSTFFWANSKKLGTLIASLAFLGLATVGCTEGIDEEDSNPTGESGSLHVDPELYEDAMGDTCRDAGIALGIESAENWIDCKIDDPPSGDHIYSDASDFESNGSDPDLCAELLEIGMDIYDTDRGEEMDWESLNDQPIIAVLVKGGPDANLYYYDPPELQDEGLHSPFPPGQSETWADISHVSFCIGEPEPEDLELTVSKTVETTAEGAYQWAIDKSIVGPDFIEISINEEDVVDGETWPETATFDYLVEVDVIGFSEEFSVFGTITIENETDEDAQIADVTDVVNGVSADVDCGVSFDPYYLLEAGDTLECDYEATGLTGDEDTNTATVTVTPESLVDGGTAVESVDFGDTEADLMEVTVVDQLEGEEQELLGTCNAGDDLPCQFEYSREFFCPDDIGTWENVATIVETEQSDDAQVELLCTIVLGEIPKPPKDPKPPKTEEELEEKEKEKEKEEKKKKDDGDGY